MTINFRSAGRMAALTAGVVTIVLLGPVAGHAQAISFVFSGNTKDALHNYSSSGRINRVTHNGTGSYTVTLPRMGNGLSSNVQVNALNAMAGAGVQENADAAGIFCMTAEEGWYSEDGRTVLVGVNCYDSSGAPHDAQFKMLYQARHRRDAATPVIAFLWADKATASRYKPNTSYQFSSEGRDAIVTRTGNGNYTVNLPLMTAVNGTALVTAYGKTPAHCAVMRWIAKGTGVVLKVACADVSGAPFDTRFSLVYSASATAGYGAGTPNGAAILADKPHAVRAYTPDPDFSISMGAAPMTVRRIGTGTYQWMLTADQPWGASTVFVTPYGAPGNFCSGQAGGRPPQALITVNCFDSTGHLADTAFTATFQTSNGN